MLVSEYLSSITHMTTSQRASVIEADIQRRATLAARHARLAYANERKLSEDIAQRRTTERVAALNLAQFASENQSIDLGVTEVEKLIYTLEVCLDLPIHRRRL